MSTPPLVSPAFLDQKKKEGKTREKFFDNTGRTTAQIDIEKTHAARVIYFFFTRPICYPRPSSLSPSWTVITSRNSDPGSHSRLFSSLPTTVRTLHFHRENTSALSCLVNSSRSGVAIRVV